MSGFPTNSCETSAIDLKIQKGIIKGLIYQGETSWLAIQHKAGYPYPTLVFDSSQSKLNLGKPRTRSQT